MDGTRVTHKPYEHILGKYLGRIASSLEVLRMTEDSLLQMDAFCRPLFELLYAGIVAGIEKYIEDRLLKEALFSEQSAILYVEKYNQHLNGRRSRYRIQLNTPLTEEDKNEIAVSVSHQVYHRINDMAGIFKAISDVDLLSLYSWNSFEPIIEKRHRIIHHGSYDSDGNLISLTIQELRSTLDLAEHCITDSESMFTSIGHGEVFENPVE